MKEPLSRVPARFRRVAVRHLESLRDAPFDAPSLPDAELAPDARPMFRPDVDGVAYWEFGLVGDRREEQPGREAGAQGDDAGPTPAAADSVTPQGFIVVSTGDHDFPIPHWSFERPPVSSELEEKAQRQGKAVSRIYRLDALAYLAEDEAGEEVARSGQLPGLVEGATPPPAPEGNVGSMIVRPKERRDDAEADRADYAIEMRGPTGQGLQVTDPQGWRRLKERYARDFEPMLANVRRNAARAWKIDRDVEEFGEGLMAGDSFSLRLLERDARVEVRGDGKPDVTLEVDAKRRGPPLVRGRSRRRSLKQERSFEISVAYPSGETETLRYFLVSPDTPSNRRGDPESSEGTQA